MHMGDAHTGTMGCSRRACLGAAAAWALAGGTHVHAGGQQEEALADATRSALTAAIGTLAPPEPVFASTEARMVYLRWLVQMSERLQGRKPDRDVRREFLQTAWYEAQRAGLEVSLVLGLIQVESAFRQHAISVAGARGYMQVMPFWNPHHRRW
jgi:soluble lytic murein transglycosylase-like protein